MTIQQAAKFISKYGGDGVPSAGELERKSHSSRKLNLWKKGMLLKLEEERIRVETAFTRLEQHYESSRNLDEDSPSPEAKPQPPRKRKRRRKKKEDEGMLDRIFFGDNKKG